MNVQEAIRRRHSVRKFTDEPVARQDIEVMLLAAQAAPSACAKRPWAFYVVTNPELLRRLKSASLFTRHDAPLAIIVCGDQKKTLGHGYGSYWIQDCSAATENLLLTAVELGLGAVWCGIHPQERAEAKVRELLSLPENHVPLNIVFCGHPKEEPKEGHPYDADLVRWVE